MDGMTTAETVIVGVVLVACGLYGFRMLLQTIGRARLILYAFGALVVLLVVTSELSS